jgi:hypothetical protein
MLTPHTVSVESVFSRSKPVSRLIITTARVVYLFRIARAEWSQCRHRLALGSWGYGKLERME